jgi:hypothetical protein
VAASSPGFTFLPGYSLLCYSGAHGNKKETKTSHLSSKESFDVYSNFVAHEKGCVKSIQVNELESGSQKEGRRTGTSEEKN